MPNSAYKRKFKNIFLILKFSGFAMWDYITERVKREAEYIIETSSTVRAAALYFGISKSTVHKDVAERLYTIDKNMYAEVRTVLNKNLSERHIRGGMATKNKYLRKNQT